jgi:hypothetical protein
MTFDRGMTTDDWEDLFPTEAKDNVQPLKNTKLAVDFILVPTFLLR